MITLRPVTMEDISLLDALSFAGMHDEEKRKMIAESEARQSGGQYWEMLLAFNGDRPVGYVSLFAHAPHIISCGPEIIPACRRMGYAYAAETQALAYAAAQGYTVAVAYVREDNLPSIRLHEKLGFELDAPYTGRNQKRMRLYIKALAANSTEICSTEQKIQEKNHA